MSRFALTLLVALALTGLAVSSAHADLAPWDQEKVQALGTQLDKEASTLYSTFYKQPVPGMGSGQRQDYESLKQAMRRIQMEARELSKTLGKGEGREQTHDIYKNLMQLVRDAREDAQRVFTTKDVQDQAAKVRQILNQLSPYYDPDAQPLQPVTR